MASLLSFYIIYFNAIDMLFAKLAKDGIKININIAGFVIEAVRILCGRIQYEICVKVHSIFVLKFFSRLIVFHGD